MTQTRRKGVAIVDTKKGILVGAMHDTFILPGGGTKGRESRRKASVRELYEETGLKAKKIKYLFRDVGIKWHNHKGRVIQNHSKVFLIEANGKARPRHEIKKIDYWKPGSRINLGGGSRKIIEKYLEMKHRKI